MIVTTTSISIRVTPARACVLRFIAVYLHLYCNIIDARNRNEHTEHKGAHDDPHDEDHKRFEDGREPFDRRTGFLFVDVRHTREHKVELAGLLAYGEQMRRQGREHSGSSQGLGNPFAALDALRHLLQRIRHAPVEQDTRRDLKRLNERHGVSDERRHGASESRGLGLAHGVTENGYFQTRLVPPEPAARRSRVEAETRESGHYAERDHPAPILHDL